MTSTSTLSRRQKTNAISSSGGYKDNEETDSKIPLLQKSRKSNQYVSKSLIAIFLISLFTLALLYIRSVKDNPQDAKLYQKLMPPDPQRTDTKIIPSYTPLHLYKQAAVCSDSEVCSSIGSQIFKKNGSIVDATLATMFCAGLTNMQSMGIGGGFIMNIYIKKDNKAYTLDARDISAKAATEDMHLHDPSTTNEGPLSITTPGELKGYWEAHKRFGKLPWKKIMQPSIDLCKDGFEMSKHMYDSLHTNAKVKFDEQLRQMYVDEQSNEFFKPGTIIKPNLLCKTLEYIAENGGNSLYEGELAEKFERDLKDVGSIITKEDLESYKVRWNDSIPIDVNGDIMYVIPPPASGILVSFIINILKNYNFKPQDLSSINTTVLTYHRIIEAFKYSYGKRTQIGDPMFTDIEDLVRDLTSPEYAEQIRLKIVDDSTKNDPRDYGGQFHMKNNHGTAHISVIGPTGDAVSVTSSVNFYFGAALTGKRTGIIFNSGMDDFSSPGLKNYFGLPGSEPNYIRPQKRALSSMSPTIVVGKNGEAKLVVGAAGGTKITTAVAMIIMKSLWFNSDIKEAVDTPRIHHQLIPMSLQYEYGNLEGVLKGLEKKGHEVTRYRERGSIVCGIAKNETGIYANADFRKGGDVVGY
ncbi:glutathione hydrolase 1 proenzyme-like isoform X2 [Toxorhynchites rutilus septentrionalis]|uniref:glutathione hydrolase 1 proenzyme-like isoform X2 n=1 Tax=Toxorhynchites rutilus septentrionalis TaxID=329112 RepID=UPI00247A8B16|nr:glutathione hydrolase 1 proenzyme-like isoform X2 [Toxorhynchites rutilus septentrionalis]XP_055618643.1 glutathione hydrolase 1 proenzyme-like isoform X2 [Toxorhynchites rutilus septentrionalis]